MSGKYFHNKWWEMMDQHIDPEKDRRFWREWIEVRNEMIYQEHMAGVPVEQIAKDFGMHHISIWRIVREVKNERS
jgi:hypothetical protein